MRLRPGTYLQDRYEILEQIGSGGMSVVYKAKCHKLNRLVAIKVLKDEFCSDSTFVSKFKMEAQSAAGLSHPNIVSVYDVIDEGRLHYIVMELIEGITLKSYITRKGRLEIRESIGIAIQVAQGIAAAHEQHIIHRDIKPQNMIISRDGKVKVADFGIARAVSAQTLSSAAMGSVHYISPEQARGGFSDERSDIYSLGITMYEMVTGRLPFEGENTVAIALAHLEDAMVPPKVYNPEIPASLERIILKCTEKKPERRYSCANEVIAALRRSLLSSDENLSAGEDRGRGYQGEGRSADQDSLQSPVDSSTIVISSQDIQEIKERNSQPLEKELTRNLAVEFEREMAATDRQDGGRKMGDHLKAERQREEHLKAERQRDERQKADYQREEHLKAERQWDDRQKADRRKMARRRDRDEDDVNPYIERLLAGAGVLMAVVIVAVLIIVVSKLGGAFRFGTSGTESSSGITVGSETESALSDTEIYMPDLRNLPEDLAENQLKESFITMKRTYAFFDDVEKGRIASQDPAPETVVLKGSSVNVVISNGSDKLDITSFGIDNLDGTTAKKFLENRNLVVEITEEESADVEKGKVLRYEPEQVAEGGVVTLYVSSGPHVDKVAVPQLAGKSEEEAIALLAEAGLTPGETSQASSDTVPKGHIISQSGGEEGQIEVGGQIGYVVSSGPEVKHQRYVASIDEVYDVSSLIGPGAGGTNVSVMVRLRQGSDDNPVYKVLMEEKLVSGDVLLPISFTSIESINGTDQGSVEVLDVATGAILKSYPLTFFPMD
ncbi:MAG: protein kinase [Eubacteriales bacterium]|nr:protein kinase [Eubacteriales bacterium]